MDSDDEGVNPDAMTYEAGAPRGGARGPGHYVSIFFCRLGASTLTLFSLKILFADRLAKTPGSLHIYHLHRSYRSNAAVDPYLRSARKASQGVTQPSKAYTKCTFFTYEKRRRSQTLVFKKINDFLRNGHPKTKLNEVRLEPLRRGAHRAGRRDRHPEQRLVSRRRGLPSEEHVPGEDVETLLVATSSLGGIISFFIRACSSLLLNSPSQQFSPFLFPRHPIATTTF